MNSLHPSFSCNILIGSCVISGFCAPYDGKYSSGIIEPFVLTNVEFHVDGVIIPSSNRCIRSSQSSCYNQFMIARATLSANQTITVKCEVLLENTRVVSTHRILNTNCVFIG
jgi:hypothetical protein